jgi:hypothetical protein
MLSSTAHCHTRSMHAILSRMLRRAAALFDG